jgi:integrase
MPIINIDRKTVATLTEPNLYWDAELKGFGYRLHIDKGGNRRAAYIIQFRVKGTTTQRKITIGDAAKISASVARDRAKEMFADITLGRDPEGKADAGPKITLRKAIDQYIEFKQREFEEGTYSANSMHITRLYLLGEDYFGPLHRKGLNEVTRQDVATRLNAIRLKVSDITAGRARAQLTAFYTRMMQDGVALQNPVVGTKPQAEKPERDRFLTSGAEDGAEGEPELARLWRACDQAGEFGRLIRLLMLTGCRRDEISELRWSEIDLDAGTIKLPAERCKNGYAHSLTLPPMAMDIIRSIPQRVGRDFVFGERGVGFTSWQRKSTLNDGIAEPWVIHDIRRSVATGMGNLGVAPHVIEAVLNHVGHRAGVSGVYNRGSYDREKRNALALWASHIESIVSDEQHKLIAFPQSA